MILLCSLKSFEVDFDIFEWSIKEGLEYTRKNQYKNTLDKYVDVHYTGNMDTRKYIMGFVFTLFRTTIS